VSRILIVDDDPSIVQMLSEVLTDEGYEVVTATQSLRAFDRAKEAHPDLILMDIMMPYLDGLDQIKLLSLDDDLKDVPIIVITAKAHALDDIGDLRALRIVDYLYKPFEISDLLRKIEAAVPSSK
jgi:CheY-like chemotaxis protein